MDTPESISDLSELLGKSVIVGITRLDSNGELVSQQQFYGQVESIEDNLVHVKVAKTGQDFTLPPDPSAFIRANPGEYRLKSTGEIAIDPDFTTLWTIYAKSEQ